MELNVATELKLAGTIGHSELTERFTDLELNGRQIVLTEPVRVDVSWSFDGDGFTLSGTLSSAVLMNCTKCNDEFIEAFSVDFTERFLRVGEAEAEELECYPYSGDVLVLDKMVEDLVLLNAPMYGLCRPDCRGLCPICGTNLNNTQCSCTLPDEGNPFAALKELKELLKDD
ncbi:MAG: DUF177 domain-containing protein [Clostridia bacterium]|nr:DUF177 domain-containing protein [Clostridia bacterium]